MSNSHTVKIEVNLGVLRVAHGSMLNEARRARQSAKKVDDVHLAKRLEQQAKSFETQAAELLAAIDKMEIA